MREIVSHRNPTFVVISFAIGMMLLCAPAMAADSVTRIGVIGDVPSAHFDVATLRLLQDRLKHVSASEVLGAKSSFNRAHQSTWIF